MNNYQTGSKLLEISNWITALHDIKGVGKLVTFPIFIDITKSSPYKQLPFGACGLLTHCLLRQVFPESQLVPFIAPIEPLAPNDHEKTIILLIRLIFLNLFCNNNSYQSVIFYSLK